MVDIVYVCMDNSISLEMEFWEVHEYNIAKAEQ